VSVWAERYRRREGAGGQGRTDGFVVRVEKRGFDAVAADHVASGGGEEIGGGVRALAAPQLGQPPHKGQVRLVAHPPCTSHQGAATTHTRRPLYSTAQSCGARARMLLPPSLAHTHAQIEPHTGAHLAVDAGEEDGVQAGRGPCACAEAKHRVVRIALGHRR
jgi:hypothetical protein